MSELEHGARHAMHGSERRFPLPVQALDHHRVRQPADHRRLHGGPFEDQLVEGRMTFDYRVRAGVVTKSNA
jgi:hypothetical protein